MFGKKKKRSFIDKLTGSVNVPDYDDEYYEDVEEEEVSEGRGASGTERTQSTKITPTSKFYDDDFIEDEEPEGELSVDVFETPDEIIVKSMVAGVKPSDLDIDIARDMVTIKGVRESESEVEEENYYHKELYWGSFTRSIVLPEEIDVDMSEATEKHGLLILRLPKVDKARKAKLRVKSEK